LSFGESKLNVVLTQSRSSALAPLEAARSSTAPVKSNLIADVHFSHMLCSVG
jgi:hypothetical protein